MVTLRTRPLFDVPSWTSRASMDIDALSLLQMDAAHV